APSGRHRPVWVFEMGGAAAVSKGGLGRTYGVRPSIKYWFTDAWGAEIAALLPVNAAEVSAAEGTSSVQVMLVGGALSYRWLPLRRWHIEAGVGGGAAILQMNGSAVAPFRGRSDHASSPAAFGLLAFAYDLDSTVRVGAGAFGGSLFRPVEV